MLYGFTTRATILSVLRRGRKSGLTAQLIAERGQLNLNTTRTTLTTLLKDGEVTVVGTEAPTGGLGRPVNRYALTA